MSDPGAHGTAKRQGEALEAALERVGVMDSLLELNTRVTSISRELFRGDEDAERAACDYVLGLIASHAGVSKTQDVVHSRCWYDAAVAYAGGGGNANFDGSVREFYDGHLSDAVSRTWDLVAEDHGWGPPHHIGSLAPASGMLLVELIDLPPTTESSTRVHMGRMKLRLPLTLMPFRELKERMDRLLKYIVSTQLPNVMPRPTKKKTAVPTVAAVVDFLREEASKATAGDSGTADKLRGGGRRESRRRHAAAPRRGSGRGSGAAPSCSSSLSSSSSSSDVSAGGEDSAAGDGKDPAPERKNMGVGPRNSKREGEFEGAGGGATPTVGGPSGEEEEEALMELMGQGVGVDDITTFDGVLDSLSSCRIDGNGDVAMSHDDWNRFENSLVVSSMIFRKFDSNFHPHGAPPVPLDALAGATPSGSDDACLSDDGPQLRFHLQRYPRDHGRFVGVMSFQNHLSKHFMGEFPGALEELPFQSYGQGAGKFLRVSTEVEGAPPLMTFGNDERQLRFVEATSDMQELERRILKITNYVHAEVDDVLRHAKAILKYRLMRRIDARAGRTAPPGPSVEGTAAAESRHAEVGPPPNPITRRRRKRHMPPRSLPTRQKRRRTLGGARGTGAAMDPAAPAAEGGSESERGPEGANGGRTHALHLGCDNADSLAWHATRCKPYNHHSDTRPHKPCNHNNDCDESHEQRMRICTHCFAMPRAGGVEVPDKLVTIRHGFPGPDGSHEMCQAYGHFCSDAGAFVRAGTDDEAIPLGTACHAHMQMPGSQADLHHFICKCKGVKEEFIRAIASPRRFGPFRRGQPGRERAWVGKVKTDNGNVTGHEAHRHLNVVGMLCERARSFASLGGTNAQASPRPAGGVPPPTTRTRLLAWNCPTMHRCNEAVLDGEVIRREAVVGAPHNVSIEDVARSAGVARKMAEQACTMLLALTSTPGTPVVVGPMVQPTKDGGHELVCPGEQFSERAVDETAQLTNNNRNSAVVNGIFGDIVHLRREGKNSASVLQNVLVALQGRGPLKPMKMRGSGGALCKAGQRMMSSHSTGSVRGAPTHVVSTGQKWTALSELMDGCCLYERCLNVFFQGIYLGPFYVSSTYQGRLSKEEAAEEQEELMRAFAALHDVDGEAFPSRTPREGTNYEMASMRAIGRWYTLEPLDAQFVEKYGRGAKAANRTWRLVNASPGDFVLPMFPFPKDEVEDEFGDSLVDVHDLVQNCEGLSFLTEDAIARELPERADDLQGGRVRPNEGAKFGRRHVECALVHAAGVTWGKTCCEGVVNQGDGTMLPPRALLEDVPGHEKTPYLALLDFFNLKPFFMKGVHPGHMSHDAAVHLSVGSTGGYEASLRQVGVDGEWLHRNGPAYVIDESTRDEAGQFMFQGAHCALTNPSTMVDIFLRCESAVSLPDQSVVAPLPGSEYFREFMETLQTHDIGNRVVHPTFAKVLDAADYIKLVRELALQPGKVFRDAIGDVPGRRTRSEVLERIQNALNRLVGREAFKKFHVQVIMRTIEMCLHEPFGRVEDVPQGPGSKDAARCFERSWDGLGTTTGPDGRIAPSSVPAVIVRHLNAWADQELNGTDNDAKARMERVLLVLGLTWSDKLGRLVHGLGIGKMFDESDAEHLLCLMHTLHQATLPARTISKDIQVDTAKLFPIRVNVGTLEARKLPFMSPFVKGWRERVAAYKALLGDIQFEQRTVDNLFRIDNEGGQDNRPNGLSGDDREGGDAVEGGGDAGIDEGDGVVTHVAHPKAVRAWVGGGEMWDEATKDDGADRGGGGGKQETMDRGDKARRTELGGEWVFIARNGHRSTKGSQQEAHEETGLSDDWVDVVTNSNSTMEETWNVLQLADEASNMMSLSEPERTAKRAEINMRLMLVPVTALQGYPNADSLTARKKELMDVLERNNSCRVEGV